MMHNSTTRFSNRVNDYVKYRPSYPNEILNLLQSECDIARTSVIADIGSGTGILTSLLLQYECPVIGIEPNKEMREAAEELLGSNPFFNNVAATDYERVNHMNIGNETIGEFFSPSNFQTRSFYNSQKFDFEGLKGRCLSSSYIPDENSQGYDAMISELSRIFEKNQENGIVIFEYQTKVHGGQLTV